jgi:hypothetical protein
MRSTSGAEGFFLGDEGAHDIFVRVSDPALHPAGAARSTSVARRRGANKNARPNGVCTARQACALGCKGIPRSRARPKRIGAAEPRQREEHEAPTITRTSFPTYCFPAHAAFPNWSEGRHPHCHFRGPRHHAGNPGIGTPDVCRIRITLSSNTTQSQPSLRYWSAGH